MNTLKAKIAAIKAEIDAENAKEVKDLQKLIAFRVTLAEIKTEEASFLNKDIS
jgi:hypothetical protein